MRHLALLLPALLVACATSHEHTGFHFQGSAGFAAIGDEGIGGTVSAAGGAAVQPNLILGAQVWGSGVGVIIEETEQYGFGPMLKYYFMPANVYVSATPSFVWATRSGLFDEGREEWGFGLRAAIGKEWFVSEGWGLGIGGVFDVTTATFEDDDRSTAMGGAVVFSASFD